MTEARIYLIDDNDGFRESTAWLLETAGFEVLAYPSGPAFLETFAGERQGGGGAQCIVSDIRMPLMSGLQLQEELRRRGIGLPLVFVTAHGDVPLAVEAMRKGASNFLEKPFNDDTLIDALRTAMAHARQHAGADGGDDRLSRLSPRERQVMDLVVASKPNKIIADVLGISVKTVELHRSNMMNKLGVRSLPELMKVALGHG
ncbi:response regulator [Lysobacter sp. BMK333-48F3]|uniref:response regulator transcription factor n=1 Tax=Lysobacter sp. BMK333-48F3 TaxID=2867962 RepID=UPI001C8BD5E8|nr:response regulator [Lysobacter sp. BMK333-48F3]MBX9401235.1 response regulator [Lysobacter sp. BMK333-48F3]